jgi:iron complex outermembrane receptor protein
MAVQKNVCSPTASCLPLAIGAIVGLLCLLSSQAALAQSVDGPAPTHTSESDTLQEVIVTARKREEVLQDVPLAATAYTGAELKQQSVKTVTDLQALVPSLMIQEAYDDPQSIIVTMRGRKQDDATLAVDSSVSLNVDGLYIPRTLGMAGSMLDISRFEALRGPQGTLYGRNTTGGALGIFTNDPTDDLSGSIDVTGGNYGAWNVVGIANIPIAENLDARFVAQRGANNGYARNSTGSELDSEDSQYYRAKLRWTGPDNLQVVLSAHYESNNSGSPLGYVGGLVPAGGGLPEGGYLTLETQAENPALSQAQALALLKSWVAAKSPFYELNNTGGLPGFADIERWDSALNITGNVTNDVQFHSISGIQHLLRSVYSGPESAVYVFNQHPFSKDDYYSQEFQILGSARRFNWVTGVYGGDELGQDNQKLILLPEVFGFDAPLNANRVHNTTLAGYAQATWEFISDWHLTAGARYTRDTRRVDATVLLGTPPTMLPAVQCLVPAPGVPLTPPGAAQCPGEFAVSFERPTWVVSLDHQLTSDVLLYAKAATGYRSGGSNAETGANDEGSFVPFQPETNLEYEVGIKSELLDHTLRLNLAAYHDKYSNLQVQTSDVSPSGYFVTAERNAATATIEGVEAEATAIVTSGLRLHASAAYTDAHYDSFPDIDLTTGLPIDRSNEPFSVPKWSWSFGGNYKHLTPIGDLSLDLEYSWRSAVNIVPEATLVQQVTQASFGLLDARGNWHLDAQDLDIALFGRNLTNKRIIDNGFDAETAGFDYLYEGPPRTFGIEVIKHFGK